jgi:hypothetical protein
LSSLASSTNCTNLNVRQLYVYVMRHYLQMLNNLKGKKLLARHIINANWTTFREFVDFVERLSFESSKIIALKKYARARNVRNSLEIFKSLLVTNGVRTKKKRRCELLNVKKYVKDNESLFVNHLYDVDKKQDEGITSFFVRKFIYSAFFEKLSPLFLKELHSKIIFNEYLVLLGLNLFSAQVTYFRFSTKDLATRFRIFISFLERN